MRAHFSRAKMNKPRLIQLIKRAGLAVTREEATNIIRSGRVKVKGNIVTDIYYQTRQHNVTVDGKPIELVEEKVYFLLNKPPGYSCQKTDNPNIIQLFKLPDKKLQSMLFSIGRLDIDTTGLLIVTNDGSITHQILKPEMHVWKTYITTTDKEINSADLDKIKKGIIIEVEHKPYKCLDTQIRKINPFTYEIKIKEGKKRQIRKMLEAVGAQTIKLHRQAIGGLVLPNLKEGEYKAVTLRDLEKIFEK